MLWLIQKCVNGTAHFWIVIDYRGHYWKGIAICNTTSCCFCEQGCSFEHFREVKTINNLYNGTTLFKNVNNYLNTHYCLETSGGKSSNLYLSIIHFFNTSEIRHMWQHKTVVFLHWCLIHSVLLHYFEKLCLLFQSCPLQA
jgi:hypothetical protein